VNSPGAAATGPSGMTKRSARSRCTSRLRNCGRGGASSTARDRTGPCDHGWRGPDAGHHGLTLCCVTCSEVRRTEGLPDGEFFVSAVSLRRSGGSGAPLDDPGPDLSVMTAGLTVPGVRLRADMHKLDEQIHALDRQLQDVEQRLSRLESKMDFIESCITHRNEPAPGA